MTLTSNEAQTLYESLPIEDQGALDIEMSGKVTELLDQKYGQDQYEIDDLGEEPFKLCIGYLQDELQPNCDYERS